MLCVFTRRRLQQTSFTESVTRYIDGEFRQLLQQVTRTPFAPGHPRLGQPKHRAGVAQLVERKALNLVVKGSSPFFGDTCFCPFVLSVLVKTDLFSYLSS